MTAGEGYTPTTEDVRDLWKWHFYEGIASDEAMADADWNDERMYAQFDRWFEQERSHAAGEKPGEVLQLLVQRLYEPGLIQSFGGQEFVATSVIESIVRELGSEYQAAPPAPSAAGFLKAVNDAAQRYLEEHRLGLPEYVDPAAVEPLPESDDEWYVMGHPSWPDGRYYATRELAEAALRKLGEGSPAGLSILRRTVIRYPEYRLESPSERSD